MCKNKRKFILWIILCGNAQVVEFVFETFNVVLFALDVDIFHKEKDHLIRKVLDPLTYKLYVEIATKFKWILLLWMYSVFLDVQEQCLDSRNANCTKKT